MGGRSSTAIAAAVVVFPTPPLPMVSTTPWPPRSIASMSVVSDPGKSGTPLVATTAGNRPGSAVNTPRSPARPVGAHGSNGTSVRGSRKHILDWVETWTFNAPKCMAVFKSA